jgi:hypothetical protein
MSDPDSACYRFRDNGLNQSCGYRLSAVSRMLDDLSPPVAHWQLFELGFGNGSVACELTRRSWDLAGIDLSVDGSTRRLGRD